MLLIRHRDNAAEVLIASALADAGRRGLGPICVFLSFSPANDENIRALLDDPEGLTATREKLVATRDWLCAQLKKDNRPFIPSHGNFVMIDVGTDTKPIIDAFSARNILVGRRFPSMPTFLRVTIGTQPEVEAFFAALRQIVPQPAAAATGA